MPKRAMVHACMHLPPSHHCLTMLSTEGGSASWYLLIDARAARCGCRLAGNSLMP